MLARPSHRLSVLRSLSVWLACLAAVFVSAPAAAHPMATDYFELEASGQDVELAFATDLQALFEVLSARRADDKVTDAAAAERAWQQWIAYFEPRFTVLAADTEGALQPCVGGPLHGPVVDVERQRYGFGRQYRCPTKVTRLTVRTTLFHRAPTMHHLSGRYWIDGCSRLFFFSERSAVVGTERSKLDCQAPGQRRLRFPGASGLNPATGPGRGTAEQSAGESSAALIAHHVPLGVSHILEGVDHLLFVISLLLGISTLKELLRLVTAFTLAHSLTLLLAALQLFEVSSRLVEVLIAVSIGVVAVENLRSTTPPLRQRVALTAAFGLVHGLGFSGAIRNYLPSGVGLLTALLSFNVGVELGQLLVILPLFGLLLWARRKGFWPGRPALVLNGILVIIAAGWAVGRVLGYAI